MNAPQSKRVSYDVGLMKSLRKLPTRVTSKFMDMMTRYMANPTADGLNFETVNGARDSAIKSLRLDQAYRAIAFDLGRDIMFVHVNEHDKAYQWARGRKVFLDSTTNRIRVIQEIEVEGGTEPQIPAKAVVSPTYSENTPTQNSSLFDAFDDKRLIKLGVAKAELNAVRAIRTEEELEASEDNFDALTFNILYGLAAGYTDEEVADLVGAHIKHTEQAQEDDEAHAQQGEGSHAPTFEGLLDTDESRQTIFTPENAEELRRFFEGELDTWRVWLHPEQRRFARRDYKGPAMVRGGAGTGKTVVAMHRAKYLADKLEAERAEATRKILVTTFTNSLATDIKNNLKTLCPEHLRGNTPRIEVVNLDRWVYQFLSRKNFPRKIVYFGLEQQRLDDIWDEVLTEHALPNPMTEMFVRAEWTQIIQAKGIMDRQSYFRVSRAGRGTPLDRRKRADLWEVFEDYRARLTLEGLAEPDDAYREAISILSSEDTDLGYAGVIVDEAQDMGEQAFRLIRAIVPTHDGNDSNSLFIVGDAHQRIYARKASMGQCGINIRGRSRRLKLNYRTTEAIRQWAVSVVDGVPVDDLDDGIDNLSGYLSIDRTRGLVPEVSAYPDSQSEIDGLAGWIRGLNELGVAQEDIGILCHAKRALDRLAGELAAHGIETFQLSSNVADDRSKMGVRLCTMHRAKGLEFKAVALPRLSHGEFPSPTVLQKAVDAADLEDIQHQFKCLLHVAATRAKSHLKVSWAGAPSELLPV